jgi:hypothetical protein
LREKRPPAAGAAVGVRGETLIFGRRVVDLPGNPRGIELLKYGIDIQQHPQIVFVAPRVMHQPWVVPPVMVAMRLGMVSSATGENQRSETANCDAM